MDITQNTKDVSGMQTVKSTNQEKIFDKRFIDPSLGGLGIGVFRKNQLDYEYNVNSGKQTD